LGADFDKYLFVTRHAHRDVTDRLLDNGLSEKGRLQAKALGNYLSKVLRDQTDLKIESSPRLRCQETLQPLCKELRVDAKTNPLLDEKGGGESQSQLDLRILKFIDHWKSGGPRYLVICSHGDWIPDFARLLLQKDQDLNKGGMMEITLTKGKALLFDLRQSFL